MPIATFLRSLVDTRQHPGFVGYVARLAVIATPLAVVLELITRDLDRALMLFHVVVLGVAVVYLVASWRRPEGPRE